MSTLAPAPESTVDDPHDHGHPDYLAHHFDTTEQQFDSGKLGMWLFLITEVLFFSGLFLAYTTYRTLHPELFVEAHVFLDKWLGAANTIVLLFSSLTMAWAVRSAQLEEHRVTAWCCAITLCCASVFMGVKAVEYSTKFAEGLLPVGFYFHEEGLFLPKLKWGWLVAFSVPAALGAVICGLFAAFYWNQSERMRLFWLSLVATCLAFFLGVGLGEGLPKLLGTGAHHGESHAGAHSGEHSPPGEHAGEHAAAAAKPPAMEAAAGGSRPVDSSIFFSIYYSMTGLHAIHILAGMGVIIWIMYRAFHEHFRKDYFGPVDNVGLYWHLVDLIWIYLFPLLYLIHG